MEYLLVMALSGSTMMFVYLIARHLLKRKVCARLFYLLAKAVILYYLIPLPFLKKLYLRALRLVVRKNRLAVTRIATAWTNCAVHADGRLYFNDYTKIQTAIVAVWVLGVSIMLVSQLAGYVRMTRRFAGYANAIMADRHRKVIDELKEEYGVKRSIALYYGRRGEAAMTFGLFSPIIICGKDPESREAQLLIRHELVHIRRMDVLWKMLMQFVRLLHWWNPFAWILYFEFERICEYSCDETVTEGMPREERNLYMRLIIEETLARKSTKESTVRWRAGFGNSGKDTKELRERVENLMKKRKCSRLAATALVAILAFANSITVFAYRDVVHEEIPRDISSEEIEEVLDQDVEVFMPVEAEEEVFQESDLLAIGEIVYDSQFTDEAGNVYPVYEDDLISPQRSCNHDFVAGTLQTHNKNSDGGCTVRVYNAQRCVDCGWLVRGDLVNTVTFAVCPH